jgi:hypothetical protein
MTSVIAAYFRTVRVQIAALLYFLIACILTQIPLFNYLGYEFSALMTIPTAIISGTITIQFLREHRKKPLTRRTWLIVIVDYLHINFLLLLIPLVVISLNALVVKNCAFAKGVAYYVLSPISTMFFSVALALVIGTLFRKAILVYCIIVVGILSQIIFITYTQPQLYAYNFILGFFPGITYDETIGDKNIFLLYREFTLIAVFMMISFFAIIVVRFREHDRFSRNYLEVRNHFNEDKKLWILVVICLVVLSVGHIYRDKLGIEYSATDIQQQIGRRSESDHFVFYYSSDNYSAAEMQRLKVESEYHFSKVALALRLHDIDHKKINVYIYPNSDWKRKLIGTSNTNIAKPWKNEIHLTKNTFNETFRHELVHILASEFGFPIIHASTRMGLNEGLAVAVDWDEGLYTPHQYASALLREKALENTDQLFTLSGFSVQSNTYAYIVAGSFCKYLIDRFGIDRFKFAFANGSFVMAFGEHLQSLIKDWQVYLRTIENSDISSEAVKAMFFHQSIFYKTCARAVAERNERGVHAIRVKNYSLAEAEFATSYNDAPSIYALRGLFLVSLKQKKYHDVIERFENLPANSLLRLNPSLMLLTGDAYLLKHEYAKAFEIYSNVREMNLSEPNIEASALRLAFLNDRLPPELYFRLYYQYDEDSLKSIGIDSALKVHRNLVSLLYLKDIYRKQDTSSLTRSFADTGEFDSNGDLHYFSLMRTANILYEELRFSEAKALYWQAKNYTPSQAVLDRLDEKIELCDILENEFL